MTGVIGQVMPSVVRDNTGGAAALIPGAYERNTLTYRQPGSMGADPSAALPEGSVSMDDATIAQREREGGGAPRERRRGREMQAQSLARR